MKILFKGKKFMISIRVNESGKKELGLWRVSSDTGFTILKRIFTLPTFM